MKLSNNHVYKIFLTLTILVVILGIYYVQNYFNLNQLPLQQQVKKTLKECVNDPICFKKKLVLPKEYVNLGKIITVLEEEVGPISCHELAHAIGEAAGELTKDISKNIGSCNEKCGFGCYHGVFLGALRVNPSLIDNLDSICKEFTSSSYPGQQLTACNHGLGHGLAELAKFDLVKSTILCDRLTDRRSQDECATGVLMEIIEGSIIGNGRAQLQIPENIADLCQALSQNYKDICLLNTGSYEYKRSKNAKKSFQLCRSLPAELQDNCAQDLGTDFHFILSGDAEKIWEECQVGQDEQVELCVRGAVFSSFITDPSGSTGISLCRQINPELQADCFTYLGGSISGIKGETAKNVFCQQLNSEENKYCMQNIQ